MSLTERLRANVLIIDFERIPGMAPVFDQKTRFIPASRWLSYPSTLCAAWTWYGRTKRIDFAAVWDEDGAEGLTRTHWELYDRADIVVTYNGRRADNRWARDDWAIAGLPAPRPWKDLDLFTFGVSTFGFESKSLNHLCERLGVVNKTGHYDVDTALAAAQGDERAQRQIARYNKGDVRATRAVYERLMPWYGPKHPHMGLFTGGERCCQVCGGTDFEPDGEAPADLLVYAAYRCTSCGTRSRTSHGKRATGMRAVRNP